MPGFDGTGPRGAGPMTGRARGYCMLRNAGGESGHLRGLAGARGTPVDVELPERKEVTDMYMGDSAGSAGQAGGLGHPVRYPAPGYGRPARLGGLPPFGVYGAVPYARLGWGRGFWRPRFGRGFGRGPGGGRGRRRFGWFW